MIESANADENEELKKEIKELKETMKILINDKKGISDNMTTNTTNNNNCNNTNPPNPQNNPRIATNFSKIISHFINCEGAKLK